MSEPETLHEVAWVLSPTGQRLLQRFIDDTLYAFGTWTCNGSQRTAEMTAFQLRTKIERRLEAADKFRIEITYCPAEPHNCPYENGTWVMYHWKEVTWHYEEFDRLISSFAMLNTKEDQYKQHHKHMYLVRRNVLAPEDIEILGTLEKNPFGLKLEPQITWTEKDDE
jgi:hypothetical protein